MLAVLSIRLQLLSSLCLLLFNLFLLRFQLRPVTAPNQQNRHKTPNTKPTPGSKVREHTGAPVNSPYATKENTPVQTITLGHTCCRRMATGTLPSLRSSSDGRQYGPRSHAPSTSTAHGSHCYPPTPPPLLLSLSARPRQTRYAPFTPVFIGLQPNKLFL